mgnify:CR=1 FL=1
MPIKSSSELEDLAHDAVSSTEQPIYIINNIESPEKSDTKDGLRSITLYGDVSESMAADVVQALLYFDHTRKQTVETKDGELLELNKPIKIYVSTHGGVVSDMFSILDVIGDIKHRCDVETIGLGKVMSAGVLILAAGTKGKRRIGRNCRVMLHSVIGSQYGSFANLENEMQETKALQELFFEYLCNHTKLTKTKIKKLLIPNIDVYLSAEEAIEYGIADEIF